MTRVRRASQPDTLSSRAHQRAILAWTCRSPPCTKIQLPQCTRMGGLSGDPSPFFYNYRPHLRVPWSRYPVPSFLSSRHPHLRVQLPGHLCRCLRRRSHPPYRRLPRPRPPPVSLCRLPMPPITKLLWSWRPCRPPLVSPPPPQTLLAIGDWSSPPQANPKPNRDRAARPRLSLPPLPLGCDRTHKSVFEQELVTTALI